MSLFPKKVEYPFKNTNFTWAKTALFSAHRFSPYAFNPLRCILGPALTFVLFSVAYKHINGTGEIALYLAETGRP